jgi:iron complex transport system permease protein
MQLTKAQVRDIWNADRKKNRKFVLCMAGVTAAVFLLSLCIRYNAWYYPDKFVPGKYFYSLFTGTRILFGRIFHTDFYAQREAAIDTIGSIYYLGALARLKLTFMALVTGAGLAIAGAVFQTVYRNPLASPNMLGASAGVNLGNILMVSLYSSAALEMLAGRYKLCYLLTAVCVAGILLIGRLSGDRSGNPNVMQMVMVGSIVSQSLNTITMYRMYRLEDEDLQIYQELNLGAYLQIDRTSMIIFTVVMAAGIIPVLLFRYRLNVIGLDDAQAKTAGVDPRPYRVMVQICGVLVVTAAMIHTGQAGMLAMVVPYIVRALFGADFRKVVIGSAFIGGSILMVCRGISAFTVIAGVEVPVTFVLNIILTPMFMVILAKHRNGFQEDRL